MILQMTDSQGNKHKKNLIFDYCKKITKQTA